MDVRRLTSKDATSAARLFELMAEAFEEDYRAHAEDRLRALLERGDTWVVAAFDAGAVIGGLTAHVLPMTRSNDVELFVYDVAVDARHRRRGVGRALVEYLLAQAAVGGVSATFVLAEADDPEACAFYRALGGEPVQTTLYTLERGS